jgi:predicted nucleotidyltransferase
MRIKREDIFQIKKIAKEYFGDGVKIYLFGSRTSNDKRGGDIDLYIETGLKKNIIQKKRWVVTGNIRRTEN